MIENEKLFSAFNRCNQIIVTSSIYPHYIRVIIKNKGHQIAFIKVLDNYSYSKTFQLLLMFLYEELLSCLN